MKVEPDVSPEPPSATHELVDHTSEVEVRLRAATLGALLSEAGRALSELQLRGHPAEPVGPAVDFEVTASDAAALLVDWLNELVFHAEAYRWVGVTFDVLEASATRLRARVRGAPVTEAPGFVKAATHHGLVVTERAGSYEASVILDV